ncbi:MAG: ATP-binding protein [Deltaproteobacteria bacterium]|nr:ATP-binding protein [Deltaproteobacteria bacterium]
MQKSAAGITKDVVALALVAAVEIDHVGKAEQISKYEALSAATGLRWGLWVSSGGKSVHAYLIFDRALDLGLPADAELRQQIANLLCAVVEGDTRALDARRLMRLPGWDLDSRKQPILHLDDSPEARYAPEDVRDRLVKYALSMGITDVAEALSALQLAERLEVEARKQIGEAAEELLEVAARLRATRGAPAPDDLDLAHAMVGTHSRPPIGGKVSASGTAKGNAVRYPASVMQQFAGLAYGTRVAAPCCGDGGPGSSGPAGTVMSQPSEEPRVFCHRCDKTALTEFVAPVTVVTPSVAAEVDLTELDGNEPGRWWQTPIPNEPGVYLLSGPTGCGKSTAIKAASASVSSTLALGPTTRLVRAQADDLGIDFYGDSDGDIYGPSAAVCLPSLGRWVGGVPDLLVLDEIESLFGLLHSQQIMGRRGPGRSHSITGPTYRKMAGLIRAVVLRGGRVIAADANLSPRTTAILDRILAPSDTASTSSVGEILDDIEAEDAEQPDATIAPITIIGPMEQERRRHSPDVTETAYAEVEDLVVALELSVEAGTPAVIACDTRAMAQTLEMLASTWRLPSGQPPKTVCVTAEFATPDDFFSAKCKSWDDYDVVVYNSACGQGVSYEGTRHRTVWVLSSSWLGWDHLIQLRGRCRPATHVHSYIPAGRPAAPCRTVEHWLGVGHVRSALDDRLAQQGTDDKGGKSAPGVASADADVRHSWAWEQWLTAARKHDLSTDYYGAVRAMGVSVVEAEPLDEDEREVVGDMLTDLRSALEEARTNAVVDAEAVVGDDLARLRAARGARTQAEHWSLGRMLCLDRWGVDGLQMAQGAADWANRDSKLWRQGRMLRAAMAVAVGGDALLSLRRVERARADVEGEGRYTSHYAGDERRARTMLRVLRDLGVDLGPTLVALAEVTAGDQVEADGVDAVFAVNCSTEAKTASLQTSPSWSEGSLTVAPAVARWSSAGKQAQAADVPGIRHMSVAPTRMISACLRALGLRTRRTKAGSRSDGSRVDAYTLDLDACTAWARANSRAWRRHLGHEVLDLATAAIIVDHRNGRDPEAWADEPEIDVDCWTVRVPSSSGGVTVVPAGPVGPIISDDVAAELERLAEEELGGTAPIHPASAP